MQVAFNLLEDMRASGLTPSTPTCSALIYACLQNNNFAAARKVRPYHACLLDADVSLNLPALASAVCIQHAQCPIKHACACVANGQFDRCTLYRTAIPMYRCMTR